MMRFITYTTIASTVMLIACSDQSAQQPSLVSIVNNSPEPLNCEAIANAAFTNTTITSAVTVGAGELTLPASPFGPAADYSDLPGFCRVAGSIQPTSDSDIQFEVWLPSENWNGRFMQTGNGGAAGSIVLASLVDPLKRGYAVANTDTGHQGGGGDFDWAVDHPEKVTDYAWRAVHELTVTGKEITTARFGMPPEKSYWNGCSTGGRQGLVEAQRFPEDYDAIIAGAPASNWTPLISLSILIQKNFGPDGMSVNKLALLKEAAISACDAFDGVSDRIISNPAQCDFDPGILQCQAGVTAQCLSAQEVNAARNIYAGLVDSSGQVLMPGTGPGSETLWGAYASPAFSIGTSFYKNVVLQNPQWDPATFDVDSDVPRALAADNGEHDAMNADISAFLARGGKLITYHGTTDGLIPSGNSLNYFQSMVATLGEEAVKESVRYYQIPGMDHCSGGEGAHDIDWLDAMEKWVETDSAPNELLATHPAPPPGIPGESNVFTRPACPHPEATIYKGSGDTNDATNFECVIPQN
jgi:feruloyl esterase